MLCPKCNSEITQTDIQVIYGLRGGIAEILAAGDLTVSFCQNCKIAVLSDKIITKDTTIITT